VILFPAIDILEGRAVRLVEGDFDRSTVYDDDPLAAARSWAAAGARFLHVVDLDGARAGEPRALEHLERIAHGAGVPVQYGGGLRTVAAVDAALAAGAERVVLGTAAFEDLDLLDDTVGRLGGRALVAVDVRDGHIATAGWTQTTSLPAEEAIRRLGERGVSSYVYTAVNRDGAMTGPDLAEVARVASCVRGRFIYSGGIGSLEHLRALAGLRQVNLRGVIVGKALYERRFTVAEGQAALR
jgi:phosphoribosylformimino-5-aminoimidazole carboxamide ribotide isomerase